MTQRFQKGLNVLNSINGKNGKDIMKALRRISPDMARFVVEFPYCDIYSRPGLELKTRELLTIASLVTLGYPERELRAHIANALNAGCSKKEIVETIMQMCVYAGFPAALHGLFISQEVFDAGGRKHNGRRKVKRKS